VAEFRVDASFTVCEELMNATLTGLQHLFIFRAASLDLEEKKWWNSTVSAGIERESTVVNNEPGLCARTPRSTVLSQGSDRTSSDSGSPTPEMIKESDCCM
jgi:hypothetical protein